MEALGLDSAVVGGVSFGGMLTIELMIRYPHLLKGAIIVSATAGGYKGLPGYDVPFPKRLEELKRVQVPALVIHGTEDAIFPVADAEATAGALSNAELALLKGGHQINQDNPEGFNRTVLDWLDRQGL
jgi:pimeloyl-ACP methyl ester carboxylesterase